MTVNRNQCTRCRRPAVNAALGLATLVLTDVFGSRYEAAVCPVCTRDLICFFDSATQPGLQYATASEVVDAYLEVWPWPR